LGFWLAEWRDYTKGGIPLHNYSGMRAGYEVGLLDAVIERDWKSKGGMQRR